MPIITCKVSDQEMEFIDRNCGANRSEYIRQCILAGPAEQRDKHQKLQETIEAISRKIDFMIDKEDEDGMANVLSELRSAVTQIAKFKQPPPGQMLMHESLAIETLLLLRTMASPEKRKVAMSETQRNGYKPWEPKEI